MKRLIQKSLLQYVIRHRNGYLIIAVSSIALNILLTIGIILSIGHEKIILIPPNISKTFWISQNSVSPEYLSEMSYFFTSLRFNLTPSNTETQRDILLRYITPEYYEILKSELVSESEKIQRDQITTVFYPVDIKVNTKNLETLVVGDLITTVGNSQLPTQRKTYKLKYTYHSNRLLLKSFLEEKHD